MDREEFEEYRLRVLLSVCWLRLMLGDISCDRANEAWWRQVGDGVQEMLNFVCGQGEGSSKDGGGPERAA